MENEVAQLVDTDEVLEVEEDLNSGIMAILDGETKSPVYIDDLPDAIVDGKLVLREGDYIVIEKWLTIAQKVKWLGTSLYKIKRIDPLDESGDIGLHDEDLHQGAQANWKTGPKHGWRFKQTIPGLNLHKRTKPEFEAKQAAAAIKEASKPTTTEPGVKRKGGRPKGSKNAVSPERAASKAAKEASILRRREERLARKAAKA